MVDLQIEKIEKYDEGIVCVIDILGFSKYINSINTKFEEVNSLYCKMLKLENMAAFINNVCISIFSDTILLTRKVNEPDSFEYDNTIRNFISYIREFRNKIIDNVHTDIRAGICYGKYIHISNVDIKKSEPKNRAEVYYGPAIIDAHCLAEKSDKIQSLKGFAMSKSKKEIFDMRPASILIDYTSFEKNIDNKINLEFCFEELTNFDYIEKYNDILLVNPYLYEGYLQECFISNYNDKVNHLRNIIIFNYKLLKEQEICVESKGDENSIKEKYSLDILFYNKFIDYVKKETNLNDLDSFYLKTIYKQSDFYSNK